MNAAAVALAAADRLGSVRRHPGLEACLTEDRLWLRWHDEAPDLIYLIRCLPESDRYSVLADGRLLACGSRVPRGRLPNGDWLPLQRLLTCTLPAARRGGEEPAQISPLLVRTDVVQPAVLILLTMSAWRQWAETASAVRLSVLTFARSQDNMVLVRGQPLPALPGPRFIIENGIASPCGFCWQPGNGAELLALRLRLKTGDLAWFESVESDCQIIAADDFVVASRSALRLTNDV